MNDITQLVYGIEFPIITFMYFFFLERHLIGLFNANLNGNTQEIFEIPML